MKTFIASILCFIPFLSFSQILIDSDIGHFCSIRELGTIDLEVDEDILYTALWETGEQTNDIENLYPGIYSVTLVDVYGCTEEHEFEIMNVSECTIDVVLTGIEPNPFCFFMASMHLYNQDGIEIPSSGVEYYWPTGQTSQIVEINPLNQHLYNGAISASSNCCSIDQEYVPPNSPVCHGLGFNGDVVVNEIFRDSEKGIQFIELLVIGKEICGETSDLRNIIIDDNTGNLISIGGQNTVLSELGNNPGYLRFTDDISWENVPNGSLIIIHNDNNGFLELEDDPYDQNTDGTYILNQNSSLIDFYWSSEMEGAITYTDQPQDDFESAIEISENIDGIQVRRADGALIHGISYGLPNLEYENQFPLWIAEENLTDQINLAEMNGDYFKKSSYQFKNVQKTPGIANSFANAELINNLRNCLGQRSIVLNAIEFYPNPLYDRGVLQINTEETGQFTILLLNNLGQTISKQYIEFNEPKEFKSLEIDMSRYASGLYNMIVEYPSSEKQIKKILKIN